MHTKSGFIPNFCCRGCGSSLGKERFNSNTGRVDKLCFVCCVGEYELLESEVEGEEYPEVLRLVGREWGHVSQILPRLNTPGQVCSSLDSNPLYSLFGDVDEFRSNVTVQLGASALSDVSPEQAEIITILAKHAAFNRHKANTRKKKKKAK